LEQLPAERGIAYMGFSFIVTSIVLVICSSYRIHISLRAHAIGGGHGALDREKKESKQLETGK